jgi:hypothetical protein
MHPSTAGYWFSYCHLLVRVWLFERFYSLYRWLFGTLST